MDDRTYIYETLRYYKKVLEEKEFKVIYIGLYGSQNYNLDDENSDLDVKAIIMPTLHDIIFRKQTSEVIECENGAIDVKDLLTFYQVIRKGNFSYIESIQTEYYIGDKYIKDLFNQIKVNIKSVLGAMYEKRKALTHEYPSKKAEFEKWGFDPKQYHHIVRLQDILIDLVYEGNNFSFFEYYGEMREENIDIKRNKNNYTREQVEEWADGILRFCEDIMPKDYEYEVIDLDNEINSYIEKEIKLLLKNSDVSYAREFRTFDNGIPKKDLQKFPILEKYKGQDISYIITESIDIL